MKTTLLVFAALLLNLSEASADPRQKIHPNVLAMESPIQNSTLYSCRVDVMTAWTIQKPPIRIERSAVVFDELGTSWVDVTFQNSQSVPIQAIALILEYSDNGGEVIDRIPLLEGTAHAEAAFHAPFPIDRVANAWTENVPAGGIERLHGVKRGIRTAVCSSRATITFATVQMEDGTIQTYSSEGWKLGPTSGVVPWFDALPAAAPERASFVATLKISAWGDVVSMIPKKGGNASQLIVEWLREQVLHKWIFNPALYDGQPVDSELQVLFRVHNSLQQPEDSGTSLSPITVIDLTSNPQFPRRTQVSYGGLMSGSVVK